MPIGSLEFIAKHSGERSHPFGLYLDYPPHSLATLYFQHYAGLAIDLYSAKTYCHLRFGRICFKSEEDRMAFLLSVT